MAGRKIEARRRSPAVCLEVAEGVEVAPAGTACDFSRRFCAVIGFGEAEFVGDRAERARLLARLGPRCGAPQGPLPEAEVQPTCVRRVRIRALRGKCSPAPGA